MVYHDKPCSYDYWYKRQPVAKYNERFKTTHNDLHICRDEYRSYVPSIYELKVAGANCETIASRLFEISGQEMGIDLSMDLCRKVAKKIMKVY